MGSLQTERSQLRQLIAGLLALPLTAVPFIGYANLTPEGRLVRDRALVALKPPSLPTLSTAQREAAAGAAPRYQGAVMALAYHGIGSASDGEGGFVVSPTRFAEHLATLKAAGMRTVTAAQVAAAFAGGEPLPPNAVMLSFDDGRADAMMFADPLLAQAGMAATMFVITDAAAKPGVYYASWDEIEGYARSGRWDIQSHTAGSHREQKVSGGGSLPALTSRGPGESLSDYQRRVREDLAEASAAIHAHVGRRPVAFAYPFGAYGADRTNDREIGPPSSARRWPASTPSPSSRTTRRRSPSSRPARTRSCSAGWRWRAGRGCSCSAGSARPCRARTRPRSPARPLSPGPASRKERRLARSRPPSPGLPGRRCRRRGTACCPSPPWPFPSCRAAASRR